MMHIGKKILAGIFVLMIGISVATPIRAYADDYNHDHDHAWHHDHDRDHDRNDHRWRWSWEHDHYRAYPYAQAVPANGEGMLNPRNPNLYWACDSGGHHCHWAPR